jgi:RNA polymerase sigma-70 factor (ECF subfamily)
VTLATHDLFTERSRSRLIALCTHLGGRDAAEDLAQETLLEAWRQSHKLTDPSGSEAWLAAIARNVWRRWARTSERQSRTLAAVTHDASDLTDVHAFDVELDRRELAEVLDSVLELLPALTREALVRRFVNGSSHVEIAERLGVSPDAVSMRISRGRLILRRALASGQAELLAGMGLSAEASGWRRTRLSCPICGQTAVDMRAEGSPQVLALRCIGCVPDGSAPASVYALDNPTWAELLGATVRPSTIQRRGSRFVHDYFNRPDGTDTVACTRCSTPVPVRAYERPDAELAHRRGIYAECARCGEVASVSAAGMALGMPETEEFRRSHRRVRLTNVVELESDGAPALALTWRAVGEGARLDVVLARERLRPLEAHRIAN